MEYRVKASPGGDSRRGQEDVVLSPIQDQYISDAVELQQENPYPLLLNDEEAAKSCGLSVSDLYHQMGTELVDEMSLKIAGHRYFIAESLRQWVFQYRCYRQERIQRKVIEL